jgi:hypothetical protein
MGVKMNLFQHLVEPLKEFTEEQKKSQEEFKASSKRINKALIDFEGDSVKKITEILKELPTDKPEEDKFLIDNLLTPQIIVDSVKSEIEKGEDVEKLTRRAKELREKTIYKTLLRKSERLYKLAEGVDVLIRYNSERPRLPQIAPFGAKKDEDSIPNSLEGNELRMLAGELKNKSYFFYNIRPVPNDADETSKPVNYFQMNRVRDFLITLPDDQSRRSYLLKIKSAFLRKDEYGFVIDKYGRKTFRSDGDFISQLEIEIETYNNILQGKSPDFIESKKVRGEMHRHTDLTLVRATLTLNYLLTYTKAKCSNKKKAEFISFLTSYSENTVVQKLSTLHKKEGENFIAFEKDMNVVRNHFEKLGLAEIVKMIDNDLKISEEKINP